MFCTNCGHELPQDARTCPNCGNVLSDVAAPAAEAPAAEAAPVAPEAPVAQPAPVPEVASAPVTPPAPEQSAPTFTAPAQNTYQAPEQTYAASSSMGYTDIPPVEAVDPDAKKKGIAGLVIGIIGIVLCWVPFLNLATTIACIIGTVISLKAMKALPVGSDGRGMAIAGLSCSITGLVLSAGLMACYGCIIGLGVITDSCY